MGESWGNPGGNWEFLSHLWVKMLVPYQDDRLLDLGRSMAMAAIVKRRRKVKRQFEGRCMDKPILRTYSGC